MKSVILLHGLGRSSRSMMVIEKILKSRGFRVVNKEYASRSQPIEALAKKVIPEAMEEAGHAPHFVVHSMGGILLRVYLGQVKTAQIGRTVMMGTPNGGTELVDRYRDVPGFKTLFGQAGQQLAPGGIVSRLGAFPGELGIIAGSLPLNPLSLSCLEAPHDGTVSQASARLEGMTDFISMPVSHSLMMMQPSVIRQVVHFLDHGRFRHA